jgi:hypothetical protein
VWPQSESRRIQAVRQGDRKASAADEIGNDSACYGSGLRTYAAEGLVGLAWALLRAGSHNVIGALWQADDSSTPLLMDRLYTLRSQEIIEWE